MKILVTYASAGAGHQKAAEALFQGIKTALSCEAVLADALDYTSPSYKRLYQQIYTALISRWPWLWGIFFYVTDSPLLAPLVRFVRRIHNTLNAQPLVRYLQDQQFDYIFSTHFFPTEVAAFLKRRRVIHAKLMTVVTDFDVHRIWLAEGVDCYTVASGWTRKKMGQLGLDEESVKVTGIPTHSKFAVPCEKSEMRRQLGLKEDAFTVLVATGSFGIGPIEEIVKSLKGIQILVVCGHNKNLFSRLSRSQSEWVKVYGLVDHMEELMAASDVMVTKPGGLSICEALVRRLPLIFFNAIPGQEAHNVRVLKGHGIGVSGSTIGQIVQTVEKFQSSPGEYSKAVEKTKILARPDAVKEIVSLITT